MVEASRHEFRFWGAAWKLPVIVEFLDKLGK
jgi:hypothetical protein